MQADRTDKQIKEVSVHIHESWIFGKDTRSDTSYCQFGKVINLVRKPHCLNC